MKLQCLLVDDEPLALDIIESYIKKVEGIEIVGKFSNPVKAFELLQKQQVDLIFLDINMPKLNGLELIQSVADPPKIIFTTAYRDYAQDAFELDAVDYLLKPISFSRFLRALGKAYQQLQWKPLPGFEIQEEEGAPFSEMKFIYVKADKKMVKVILEDIFYIESLKDYILIHIPGKRIITKQKISYLEEKLPEDQFLRIHRSFLISIAKIEAFTLNHVEINGKELPIGRSYKNEVAEILNQSID
jgi:DNA-binding LytR/AlgR family response regulator